MRLESRILKIAQRAPECYVEEDRGMAIFRRMDADMRETAYGLIPWE
jgi:hypothetical protein